MSAIDPTIEAALLTIAAGYIGGTVAYFWRMEGRLREIEVWVRLWKELVQKELPKLLHSPHTPELDALLERFVAGTATLDDSVKLREAILTQIDSEPKSTFTLGWTFLLPAVNQRVIELEKKPSRWQRLLGLFRSKRA